MTTSAALTIEAPDAAGQADAQAFADLLAPALADAPDRPVLVVAPRGHRLPPVLDTAIAVVPPGYAAREDIGIRVIGVGYDGERESAAAVAAATALAIATGATLRVYAFVAAAEPQPGHVPPVRTYSGTTLRERLERGVEDLLAAVPDGVRPLGQVLTGEPVAGLTARSGEIDLLVLGTRRRKWLERALFGSVARAVVPHADCPVLVLPGGAAPPFADALLGSA